MLIDIQMPVLNGLEAAEKIITQNPDAKVLFLTTFVDDDYIYKARLIGAKGYILKQDFDNILPALKAVHSGQSVFGTDIVAKLTNLTSTSNFNYEALDINRVEENK